MYKILNKQYLQNLLMNWQKDFKVLMPQKDKSKKFNFLALENISNLDLKSKLDAILSEDFVYTNTFYPLKSVFFEQSKTLFKAENNNLLPYIETNKSDIIVFGARPCDARALALLDKVFDDEKYKDPYWIDKYKNASIISIACEKPCDTCFCSTVDSSPFDDIGSDVVISKNDDNFIAYIKTQKGEDLFSDYSDALKEEVQSLKNKQNDILMQMKNNFSIDNIKENLDLLFEDKIWSKIQENCLSCGICTYVCPTCHCFDIVDEVKRQERVRNWDSCMFRTYSQEASGHNPRLDPIKRMRQRIMHKFSYVKENFDKFFCTGCGRCIKHCPANIDIREILGNILNHKNNLE